MKYPVGYGKERGDQVRGGKWEKCVCEESEHGRKQAAASFYAARRQHLKGSDSWSEAPLGHCLPLYTSLPTYGRKQPKATELESNEN